MSPSTREENQMLLERYSESEYGEITFSLLNDTDHLVIDRYGFKNPNGSRANIPHPTTLVIDREGVIRWRFTEVNYRIRPTTEQVMAELEKIQ